MFPKNTKKEEVFIGMEGGDIYWKMSIFVSSY